MEVYEELRDMLDAHPSGAPKSKYFDEILKTTFTPEEAAIAVKMSFMQKSVEDIAAATGIEPKELEGKLEAMADKPLIFAREKDGKYLYGLLPTIPGLFEFPFMKGGGTPELDKLGELWEKYHHDAMGAALASSETSGMRIVPVGRSLTAKNVAHPYEEVSKLIDNADYIALAHCACRVSATKKCDAPIEVCIILGTPGKFLVQRGFGREMSKEEAHKALDRAEEAGLVHTSNNSADKAGLICNCCPCCCTVLRGRTSLNLPNAFATSAYIAKVDAEECSGCATCADERCPMEAIDIRDEVAVINVERCIGCGLCVSTCPSAAMSLERREQPPEVCATGRDMNLKILQEKGKLEKFMEIMQR